MRNVKQGHYETYADTGTCVYNLASDLHVAVQTMISHWVHSSCTTLLLALLRACLLL